MLIKDITEVLNLKTKAKALLEMCTQDFFQQLLQIQGNKTLAVNNPEYIEEVNAILTSLYNKDYISVDFEDKCENGVLKIKDFLDDTIVNDRLKEVLLRPRLNIVQLEDGKKAHEQELFLASPDFDTLVAIKFIAKKRNALKRGIEFTLTLNDVKRLMKTKRCYYSGIVLTLDGDSALTFDRKDSTRGYSPTNTVACSFIANKVKNELLESSNLIDVLGEKAIKKMLVKFAEVIV